MPTSMLAFVGHGNSPVPHEFIRGGDDTDRLAIFLPGYAYSCDMPLFYYAETVLLTGRVDLLRLMPEYSADPGFLDLPYDERVTRVGADAMAAVQAALRQRAYRDVVVIAKSLGTLTLAHLLSRGILPPSARLVWAPPLLHYAIFADAMAAHLGPSLLVIGTEDPDYDPPTLDRLASVGRVECMVLNGADHSFDIPGDVPASIATLAAVIDRVAAFVDDRPVAP